MSRELSVHPRIRLLTYIDHEQVLSTIFYVPINKNKYSLHGFIILIIILTKLYQFLYLYEKQIKSFMKQISTQFKLK